MEAQRREHWRTMVNARRHNDWIVKLVVACCVALLFLSPGLSRMLPAGSRDSKAFLGRSAVLERESVKGHDVARSEMRGRILGEVSSVGAEDDLTVDYSTPTHNQILEDEEPSMPAARTTSRYRTPQQFSRYTAQYGHRHLRGV